MGLCLYVGMDDSNHAGENIKGEINLATFSLLRQDSIVKEFPNRRDYSQASKWIRHPKRDYRFTILTGDAETRQNNLVHTGPFLIRSFLKDFPHLDIDSIRLYLDGHLNAGGKASLRSYFTDFDFTVNNFIKKGKNRRGHTTKRPICPQLVYMADILAHNAFGRSLEECFKDPRYVPFQPPQPQRQIF